MEEKEIDVYRYNLDIGDYAVMINALITEHVINEAAYINLYGGSETALRKAEMYDRIVNSISVILSGGEPPEGDVDKKLGPKLERMYNVCAGVPYEQVEDYYKRKMEQLALTANSWRRSYAEQNDSPQRGRLQK